MVNIIWMVMFLIGFVYAMINGTLEDVNKAVFKGAEEAVTICIGLISILVFWLGIMRIAEKAGVLKALSNFMNPIASKLFPEIPKNHPAMGYILSNMTANLFGLGNAATPMGIKAMEEMKKLNDNKSTASRSMITFLVINTASITLIPTTIISIRMKYGSIAPGEIIGTTLIASSFSTFVAVLIDRLFYYSRKAKGENK